MTSKPVGIKYRFDGNKMIWTITQKTSETQTEVPSFLQENRNKLIIATRDKEHFFIRSVGLGLSRL